MASTESDQEQTPTEQEQTDLKQEKQQSWQSTFSGGSEFVFQALILGAICVLAFSTRLFSVVRYESMIHEFDPWFNFRSTKELVKEGWYSFHNWFDNMSWYPYGRWVGATVYPGLMWTSGVLHQILHTLNFPVDIRNVCVFLSPFMAANTAIATYFLTKEVWDGSAGIVAAAFISISPGYISRSVAGSYDNECIAIFAMVFTFFLWVKAVKTGSMTWAAMSALAYFYMVAAWGGYIFLINVIPFHVFVLLLAGRYSHRLYVAYCTFYVLGTLMSMHIIFVGWKPVSSPEHFASFGVFGLLQIYTFFFYVRSLLNEKLMKVALRSIGFFSLIAFGVIVALGAAGKIPFLTGRLYTLLGATSKVAIVKSVSEHQPSPWTTFFFDLHMMVVFVPIGLYFCFNELSDANTFPILYILLSGYFASIMVRLVLVLTPVCCVLGGIGTSKTLLNFMEVLAHKSVEEPTKKEKETTKTPEGEKRKEPRANALVSILAVSGFSILFFYYVIHCTWVTSTAYSSPSIVLQATGHDGSLVIFDDFREAYTWLRHNTPYDARIMSWWDYGYQITGMGNRTVIVDNNTRNNTHIATVGLCMASNEERAWEVMQTLDVDYVLVVFGGKIGYSSDDINKFLWMVRIGGGIYPEVVETDYFNEMGHYTVDGSASARMLNSLMYKACYYRFGELHTQYGRQPGWDRVRNSDIGNKYVTLTHMDEAFTSEHWMVRIYKVKKGPVRTKYFS